MSVSQATLDIVEESVESMELATRNGFHLEPRCRVCRNDLVRKKVNAMLACGGSYAQIVRALGEDNADRSKGGRRGKKHRAERNPYPDKPQHPAGNVWPKEP